MKTYDVFVRHLASENALYWSRSWLMFAAITALMAFAVKEASPLVGAQWLGLIKDGVLATVRLVFGFDLEVCNLGRRDMVGALALHPGSTLR
jgi:hypothetical protein